MRRLTAFWGGFALLLLGVFSLAQAQMPPSVQAVILQRLPAAAAVPPASTTWDPVGLDSHLTLSPDHLDVSPNISLGSGFATIFSTTSKSSSKIYIETSLPPTYDATNNNRTYIEFSGAGNTDAGYVQLAGSGSSGGAGIVTFAIGNMPTFTGAAQGDVFGVAIDISTGSGKAWFRYNGTFGGDPVLGTNPAWTWTQSGNAWFMFAAFDLAGTSTRIIRLNPNPASPPTGFVVWN